MSLPTKSRPMQRAQGGQTRTPAALCGRLRQLTHQEHRPLVTARVALTEPASDVAESNGVGADVSVPVWEQQRAAQFLPDRSAFSEQHRIRGYEVRPDQRTTIVTIANLLQEVAGNHAVGMWGRSENGFAALPGMEDYIFVMTRLQIRMNEYPKWGDIVELETYFSDEGRLAARRDWVIKSMDAKVLGAATSTWVTINMATRRLAKLPDNVRNHFMRFTPKTPRHSIPVEQTKRKLGDLNPAAQLEGPKQVARRSDMDMNGHINNVTYLAWALETVPQEAYDSHLYEVEVDFKAECLAGDLVESVCSPQAPDIAMSDVDTQFVHSIRRCREEGPQELVRCRTSWRKATPSAQ